jgi:hypothetical protein
MKTTIQTCFFLFIVFTALKTSAQTLHEFGALCTIMKASSDEIMRNQAKHLDSLMFHEQPKIYVQHYRDQVVGKTPPVSIETDVESLRMLGENKTLYKSIELIIIRLNNPNELGFILDLQALPGFEKLKYVQFLCSFDCKPEMIETVFLKNNPAITVFYNISIPN